MFVLKYPKGFPDEDLKHIAESLKSELKDEPFLIIPMEVCFEQLPIQELWRIRAVVEDAINEYYKKVW